MDIAADFVGDIARHLVHSAETAGIAVDATQDPEQILLRYLNWNSRQVKPARRRVHLSREFVCPRVYHDVMRKIRSSIEAGRDITGHLSRKIRSTEFTDKMLAEWGVQHLHLSDIPSARKPGMFEGTKELLFVRFTAAAAYFINVYQHGDWTDPAIVQILHDNWRDSIKQFRMAPGTATRDEALTKEQRRNLRANGYNSGYTTSDGTVYMLGWFAPSGFSVYDIRHCDHLCATFRAHEKQARDSVASDPLLVGRTEVKLQLSIVGSEAWVHDIDTGALVYRFLWA